MEKPLIANGLRPTARHRAVVALYLCSFLFVGVVILATRRTIGGANVLPLVFMFCLWLLGLVFVLFDQPGPVRNWAGPFVLSLSCPYVALWYDIEVLLRWMLHSSLPPWRYVLLINGLLLGGFALYFSRMYPRCCPKCGLRSLIPLLRLTRPEKRLSRTLWCASCGETLWKDGDGEWQKERRKTWLEDGNAAGPQAPGCAH